jgi:hypothetical protein
MYDLSKLETKGQSGLKSVICVTGKASGKGNTVIVDIPTASAQRQGRYRKVGRQLYELDKNWLMR